MITVKKQAVAKYSYTFGYIAGIKILMIIDEGNGREKTVTNDIDNVVAEILSLINIDAREYIITYQDSEGKWDVYHPMTDEFTIVGASSAEEAVRQYFQLKKTQPPTKK